MLKIDECIETLQDFLFTDIKFSHNEDDSLFFTGYDTEEGLDAIIQFEIEQENDEEDEDTKTLFIYVKYSNSDHFIVHSWHYIEE